MEFASEFPYTRPSMYYPWFIIMENVSKYTSPVDAMEIG